MANVFYVFKREFKANFTSPLAYVFLVVFLIFINVWFWFLSHFFLLQQADTRSLFSALPITFLFFVPAITMRLWAEEKKQGTLELLLTFPLRDGEVVAGKFIASLLFLTIAVLLTLGLPLTADALAQHESGIDWGPVIGGYAGAILLGAAYLSIGLFASSITTSQIIAYIVGVVLCFALYIIGSPMVTLYAPKALVPVMAFVGLGAHFERLLLGIIDTRDIVYYLSIIVFFLFLNIRVLESRSYR